MIHFIKPLVFAITCLVFASAMWVGAKAITILVELPI